MAAGAAAASEEAVSIELNKLTKKEIINILVLKKIPDSVNSNSVISDFFEKYITNSVTVNVSKNLLINSDTRSHENCSKIECMKNQIQCQFWDRENKLLTQTINHLEKRLVSQEELINYLKTDKNKNQTTMVKKLTPSVSSIPNRNCEQITETSIGVNRYSPTLDIPCSSTTAVSYSDKVQSNSTKTLSDKPLSEKNTSTLSQAPVIKNSLPVNRNNSYTNRRKPVIGTNKNTTKVSAVPKMGYLHVYRLNPSTTIENLKECLHETAPHIKFEFKELHKSEFTCSYMVSFPITYVKDVYDPEIWPEGAVVNRFTFHKSRNFHAPASAATNP